MKLTRRQFFTSVTGALAVVGGASYLLSENKGFLLGWGKNIYFFKSNSALSSYTGLGVWNIETPSSPHDFLSIGDGNYIAMPKWEKTLTVFNVDSKKVIKEVTLSKGEQFMGHGIFDKEKSLIYLSTIRFLNYGIDAQGTGFIKVYNSKSLELIEEFPTYGLEPHECLVEDGKLIVLNSGLNAKKQGARSSAAIIDLSTKKLISEFSSPKNFHFAHFEKIETNKYFICHEFADGFDDNKLSPYILDTNKGLSQLEDLGKVFERGGLLTPAYISKHRLIAATAPSDDIIVFWNIDTKKHVKTIKLKNPRAIFYKPEEDILIAGTKKGIYRIDPKSFSIKSIFSLDLDDSLSSHGYWV
ncbi:MAG: hypothetical protein BM556_03280 [Bacteriovorax sp. MedPE-SWde]|nr:MAG: hypothetical protein BM556_03280 [Bacteriovorax sp. MedPE-SWde]